MVIRWGKFGSGLNSFFHKTPPLAPAAGGPSIAFYSGVYCFMGLSPENDWKDGSVLLRFMLTTQLLRNFRYACMKNSVQEASLPPLLHSVILIPFFLYFTAEQYASLCRLNYCSVDQSCPVLCNPWTAACQNSLSFTTSWSRWDGEPNFRDEIDIYFDLLEGENNQGFHLISGGRCSLWEKVRGGNATRFPLSSLLLTVVIVRW